MNKADLLYIFTLLLGVLTTVDWLGYDHAERHSLQSYNSLPTWARNTISVAYATILIALLGTLLFM